MKLVSKIPPIRRAMLVAIPSFAQTEISPKVVDTDGADDRRHHLIDRQGSNPAL
jgi:hypothetical protein